MAAFAGDSRRADDSVLLPENLAERKRFILRTSASEVDQAAVTLRESHEHELAIRFGGMMRESLRSTKY
jgi:hypothetical protein